MVSALSSLERYTILKGRGFDPGRLSFSINRLNRLVDFNRNKYARTRTRMRSSRKRLLRMRTKPRSSEFKHEFDFLGGFRHACRVNYACVVKRPYTHEPDKLRHIQSMSSETSYNTHRPTSNESKVAVPKPPTGTGSETDSKSEEEHQKMMKS